MSAGLDFQKKLEQALGPVSAKELTSARKWGWLPEMRHVAKTLRQLHRQRLASHTGVNGMPLRPKAAAPPPPAVGQWGPLRDDGGEKGTYKGLEMGLILTKAQQKRAHAILRKRGILPKAGLAALYRSAGPAKGPNKKATRLFNALTKDKAPGSLSIIHKQGLQYGLTDAFADWAEPLNEGGRVTIGKRWQRRALVPRRTAFGLDRKTDDYILHYLNGKVGEKLKKYAGKTIVVKL